MIKFFNEYASVTVWKLVIYLSSIFTVAIYLTQIQKISNWSFISAAFLSPFSSLQHCLLGIVSSRFDKLYVVVWVSLTAFVFFDGGSLSMRLR